MEHSRLAAIAQRNDYDKSRDSFNTRSDLVKFSFAFISPAHIRTGAGFGIGWPFSLRGIPHAESIIEWIFKAKVDAEPHIARSYFYNRDLVDFRGNAVR